MARREADVVIVGSGVAGALVANELAAAGRDVLVLEAGPRLPRWQTVERYRNQADKTDFMACYPSAPWAPHPQYGAHRNDYLISKGSHPFNSQYIRAVGGTTWHWAASCWRFLPSDFKLKSLYGVGRDWPIDYDDLEPWYQRAELELGVWGPADEDLGSPRQRPYPMAPLPLSYNEATVKQRMNDHNPGWNVVTEPVARNSRPYDDRPTCCGNNNCMPICPIGAMYNGIVHVEKAEANGAEVIDNAVVNRIIAEGDRIVAVEYRTPKGEAHRVDGQTFVLAANGIETPKLMLLSPSFAHDRGIGNSSDMVGRNLMDHPGTGVHFYADEDLWPGRGPQEMTSVIGFRDGGFRSEYAGKKLHLSNISAVDRAAHAVLAQESSGDIPALNLQIRERAARYVEFNSFHEILPLPENRIQPSKTEKDAAGIPRPEITYHIDDYVVKSAAHTRQTYAEIARLMGGTEVTFADNFAPNNHITGSTIMGARAEDSVVDKDCRSFDHANLFIAGSSVMPTVGTVNVTLTIAALALRLADQLIREG
ncbi:MULTISPECIES: GMC family oxidoreductase [Microbulbifer]|uniref:GMC family oxidoreductase n=1 Tax=Microbulbifer celer TaxID=435905 RepID=A0ABW3UAD4_9GAMM|nr:MULTISPECIES: GMC family oxidoreductase [Microbulbifer]UFN57048.1 GMC family oxidoreductase [Microbulbifer celer]